MHKQILFFFGLRLTGSDWQFTIGLSRWAMPNSQSPTSLGNRKQEKQNYMLDTRTILINKCKCIFFLLFSGHRSFFCFLDWMNSVTKRTFLSLSGCSRKEQELVIIPLVFYSTNSSFDFLNITLPLINTTLPLTCETHHRFINLSPKYEKRLHPFCLDLTFSQGHWLDQLFRVQTHLTTHRPNQKHPHSLSGNWFANFCTLY